jgi:hypothetical protein
LHLYCKFYHSLALIGGEGGINSADEWLSVIADLVYAFNGGLSYTEAKKMPLSEIVFLQREANKIAKRIKKASENK